MLSPAAFDALEDEELVQRRLAEIAAGRVLQSMRAVARAGNWRAVDAPLLEARARFAGNDRLWAMLGAMARVAESRTHERMSKEATCAAARLNARRAPKFETADRADESARAAHAQRRSLQGKGER